MLFGASPFGFAGEESWWILLQSILSEATIDSPLTGHDEEGLTTFFGGHHRFLQMMVPELR